MKKYFIIKGRFNQNIHINGWQTKLLDDGRLLVFTEINDTANLKEISSNIKMINNVKSRNLCSAKFMIRNDINENNSEEFIESGIIRLCGRSLTYKRSEAGVCSILGETSTRWSVSCSDDDCLNWAKNLFQEEVPVNRIFNFMAKLAN